MSAVPELESATPYVLGDTHVRDVPGRVEHGYPDRVLVQVPWSTHDHPGRRYPVLYLCDGYWDFVLLAGMYAHLLFDHVVPEYILVGLAYGGINPPHDELRRADLGRPSADCDYACRLRDSVIPFIEREYPVDPSYRGIAGASIGATFALSTLFRTPGLFHGVIALAPRTDAFGRWLFELEAEYGERRWTDKLAGRWPPLAARVFMACGSADHADVVAGVDAFNRVLDSRHYRFFEKQFRVIDGETHASIKPEGMNRGLRHIFAPLVER